MITTLAVTGGLLFEKKCAWCTGLCPAHQAERLYGSKPAMTLANAHCTSCEKCSNPCAVATPSLNPLIGTTNTYPN